MEIVSMNESYGGSKRGKEKLKIYRVPVVFDKDEKSAKKIEEDSQSDGSNGNGQENYACVIGDCKKPDLEDALKSLGFEICYSKNGRRMPDYVPDECSIVFVCEEFSGQVFEYLLKHKYRIVGLPCVQSCVKRQLALLNRKRPVYSCTMDGTIVCLTGFRDKDRVRDLCDMIHWMGGSVRNKVSIAVTHVVAHNVSGAKYKNAVTFGINIMSEDWVLKCWENRKNIDFSASDAEVMVYKQRPFLGCHIALYGFNDSEATHIKEIAELNGGINAELDDPEVTHLLVANGVDSMAIPLTIPSRIHIVKQQWFWESIQIEACADEAIYYAKECRRKRHSMHDASAVSLISLDSLLEASLVSLSSPVARLKSEGPKKPSNLATSVSSTLTGVPSVTTGNKANIARHHIASELLQTEKNFVKILNLILKEFMSPLEQPGQRGGPILDHEEIKRIFGNIPDILNVHTRIMNGLEQQMAQWNRNSCIGEVLLKEAEDLLRVYPPFVNYFEMTKEALIQCDRQYPRFHAFLKFNELRVECGRQTLAELLITPVQRIPRILLLLQDLLKHTDSSHNDHTPLKHAVEALKTVMTNINEDKRKTEQQMHMFEMMKDIEECPANLLSSHRSFISRFDVVEVSSVTGKGSKTLYVTLFLFSDSMEIAKKRSAHGFRGPSKPYRHLEFLSYSHIRSIVDFIDSEDVINGFGLLVRWPEDPQERLLAFKVSGDESQKSAIIKDLSQLLAQTNYSTMADDFIWKTSAELLDSLSKHQAEDNSTLKRAIRGGLKDMKRKVKRTISTRSNRRPFTPISNPSNFDEGLEPMEESFTECDTPLNTSSCSIAPVTITPMSVLKVPSAKRPALGYSHSFSTLDLTRIGTNI